METRISSSTERLLFVLAAMILAVGGCSAPAAPPTDAGVTHWDEGGLSGPIVPETYFQPPDGGHRLGSVVPYAFPIGNASGDLTSSYPGPTVAQCSGAAGTCSVLASTLAFGQSVTSPFVTQATTSSTPAQTLSIGAQNTSATTGTGGNLVLSPGTGTSTNQTPGFVTVSIPALAGSGTAGQFQVQNATHNVFVADTQGVVLGRTDASQQGMRVAPLIGNETSNVAIWTGSSATSPTGGNYALAFNTAAGTDSFGHGLQSMASGTVLIANSSPYINFAQGVATPTVGQAQQANASNPNNFVVAPQAPGAGAASTATGTPGSFVVNLAAPVSTGNDADLLVQVGGTTLAALGRYNKTSTVGGLWLGNNATAPSNTNHTLFSDNANNTVLNAPSAAGTVFFRINNAAAMGVYTANGVQLFSETTSFGGGTGILGMANVTTAPTANPTGGLVAWTAVAGNSKLALLGTTGQEVDLGLGAAPSLTQVAQASTSGGSGANGNTLSVISQSGQPATGASNNGGNGGQLTLSSGGGGTSGSATAGVPGPVVLANALVTTMTVGPTATSGGPASIGLANTSVSITASSNTTFALTPTQYQNPMVVLTGTLTSAAVATIALPNVTAIWWFDDSAVVFTSGSINWKCGGGTASASVSSLVTTSELIMVSCRGTTVSLHTENDAVPLPTWRYAANDNALDPCDVRRRAA